MTPLIFMAILIQHNVQAHDWRELEGQLINSSRDPAACLWDEFDHLCMAEIPPGGFCLGDGMGPLDLRWVFKVPNHALFVCEKSTCQPANFYARFRLMGAYARHGLDSYGKMSFEQFQRVMGTQSLVKCRPIAAY